MASEIRVGCIGCGTIATGYGDAPGGHLKSLVDTPELVPWAMADVREEAAQRAFTLSGAEYYTTDADRVFSDPNVDLVLVCTHHDSHTDLCVRAAQAGKHIFVEKPLALSVEACKQVEEAVVKAGVSLMVGFRLRYAGASVRAKEVISDPQITVGQIMDYRWADDLWAQDPMKGGGNVLSQGCHTVDLVCWFNPSPPVSVYAVGGTMTHENTEVIDSVVASIRFENGAVASVVMSDSGQIPYLSKFSFQLYNNGVTAMVHNRCKSVKFEGVEGKDLDVPGENFAGELQDLARCLLEGKPSPIPAGDGTRATNIILKAFESVRTGLAQAV